MQELGHGRGEGGWRMGDAANDPWVKSSRGWKKGFEKKIMVGALSKGKVLLGVVQIRVHLSIELLATSNKVYKRLEDLRERKMTDHC
jgi:hypothetical protein